MYVHDVCTYMSAFSRCLSSRLCIRAWSVDPLHCKYLISTISFRNTRTCGAGCISFSPQRGGTTYVCLRTWDRRFHNTARSFPGIVLDFFSFMNIGIAHPRNAVGLSLSECKRRLKKFFLVVCPGLWKTKLLKYALWKYYGAIFLKSTKEKCNAWTVAWNDHITCLVRMTISHISLYLWCLT